eukprot:203312_1
MSQPLRRSQRLIAKLQTCDTATTVDSNGKTKQNTQKIKTKKKAVHVNNIGKNKHSRTKGKQTKQYWLMKSEPSAYSIDDLMNEKEIGDYWDGIRNYQVRNTIRDAIKCDDEALFYHSCCKPPGIAGTMIVTKESYPDFTAFDKSEKYYDPKSDPNNPRWFMFNVTF